MLSYIRQLPALCELYDAQHVVNHILPLTIRAIQDKVASVRETAVATVSSLFILYLLRIFPLANIYPYRISVLYFISYGKT